MLLPGYLLPKLDLQSPDVIVVTPIYAQRPMEIKLHPHALERLAERGANEEEVRAALEGGERFPAKHGRAGFRRNFSFNSLLNLSVFENVEIL